MCIVYSEQWMMYIYTEVAYIHSYIHVYNILTPLDVIIRIMEMNRPTNQMRVHGVGLGSAIILYGCMEACNGCRHAISVSL